MNVITWWAGVVLSTAAIACSDGNQTVKFSNLRVEDISADRAVVRFETQPETTCEVQWGLEPDELSHSATDPDMDPNNPYALDHRVPLEDLPAMRVIHFRAKATTRGGETFFSEPDAFETLTSDEEDNQLVNVALLSAGSQVIEVSSNYGGADNDESWGAEAAFDGMMSTEWSSQGDGDDAFVVVDLGEIRSLRAFAFRSRQMTDGSSIVKSVKLVFDDDEERGPFDTPDPDQRYEFALEPKLSAQRVRIQAVETTGGNTGAKEIELLSAPDSG